MDHRLGVGTIAEGLLLSSYYYLSSPRADIRGDTGYDAGTHRSTTSSR